MKTISMIGCVAALVVGMAAPASAATTNAEVLIYRFPGVTDNGDGAFVGVATSFHCTNFSGVNEIIRFVTRNAGTNLLTNQAFIISHLETLTVATHPVRAYAGASLVTGSVTQGTTAIAA